MTYLVMYLSESLILLSHLKKKKRVTWKAITMLIFYFSSSLKSLYLLTPAECDSVGWGGAQALCVAKRHPW